MDVSNTNDIFSEAVSRWVQTSLHSDGWVMDREELCLPASGLQATAAWLVALGPLGKGTHEGSSLLSQSQLKTVKTSVKAWQFGWLSWQPPGEGGQAEIFPGSLQAASPDPFPWKLNLKGQQAGKKAHFH